MAKKKEENLEKEIKEVENKIKKVRKQIIAMNQKGDEKWVIEKQ